MNAVIISALIIVIIGLILELRDERKKRRKLENVILLHKSGNDVLERTAEKLRGERGRQ